MSNTIPTLIEALREAISRSDNNKANETTLALFEAISGQFTATAEADAAIIDQIKRAPERKAILVETTPAPTETATPTAAALSGPEATTPARDPLDHDGDGKKGGSVAKKTTAPKGAK